MTLTASQRVALDQRVHLSTQEKEILEMAISDMEFRAKVFSITLAKDDRLAKLEAAMITYLLASRGIDLMEEGFPSLDIDKILWKDKPLHIRAKNERRVIYGLLKHLQAHGFDLVSVYDGEEHCPATDPKAAMETIFNLDECRIWVKHHSFPHKRNIYIVLGNADDGSEVVADWSYGEGDPDGFNAVMEAFDTEKYV